MKQHTQKFKEQISLLGKQQSVQIGYTIDEKYNVLTADDINSATPSYEGSLLKSVMKQLELDSNTDIPVGTAINFKYGLLVDEEYEYIDYGNYIVYSSEKQEDTNSYSILCYDKLLYSMKDYEKMNITYPISIRNYINAICEHLGLTFANSNGIFANYNREISTELYLDSSGNSLGYTFRDVLDELAQVTASVICINANDELEIRYINDTGDTIDEEYLKDVNVNFGDKYGKINSIVLSRSGESDNVYLRDETSVQQDGLCEIKIVDNQIMNFNDRSDYLIDILVKLKGIEYYLNDFSSTGIMYYDLLDRYTVKIGDNEYSCVMLNDECDITQGLEELIYTDEPETSETDYTKADKTDRKINQTYVIVDKQNQQIESVISQTTEQNEKINRVVQTVDELNSKISDIADITTSQETNKATLSFEKINQSEPIRIEIHPIVTNISFLYPRDNLYPSDDLYMTDRKIRFTNITTNNYIEYELPADLLYYDSENYDEFILDYDSQTCIINKKIGYNADGTTYILENSTTIEYEYPRILLEDGDYTIELLGYDTAYLMVRLMSQNIYTTQFATKAEVNSEISQTANEINLSVNKKLTNYTTRTEMNSAISITAEGINSEVSKKVGNDEVISKINQSAEKVGINANKIELSANDVLNLLAGNTINLTSKNIVITSDKLNIDKEGNITLGGSESNPAFSAKDSYSETSLYPLGILNENNITNQWASLQKGGLGVGTSGTSITQIGGMNSDGMFHRAVYNNTSSSSANVYIDGAGYFYRATGSSKRWKKDITENIEERLNPKALYNLPIKQFKYKEDYLNENDRRYNTNILGFIAEDVKEIYEPAVQYDTDGQIEMWNSDVMIPAMLKLIQEQYQQLQELSEKIEYLENKLKEENNG